MERLGPTRIRQNPQGQGVRVDLDLGVIAHEAGVGADVVFVSVGVDDAAQRNVGQLS